MNVLRRLGMFVQDILRSFAYRVCFSPAIRRRAQRIADHICPYLTAGERILDIGAGTGTIGKELEAKARVRCVYLDRATLWLHPVPVPMVLCDAHHLAFADAVFDAICLVTVLHHCDDPARVLKEALRVTRSKVIVVEDCYSTIWGRIRTIIKDALLNLEIIGHPRRFMRANEWERLFAVSGFRLVAKKTFQFRMLFVLRPSHVLYVLEPAATTFVSRRRDTTAIGSPPTYSI